jgi:4-alpha-glucanotransferase
MRLTFQVRFRTRPGQDLFITGNHPLLGRGEVEHAVPMNYLDPETWGVSLTVTTAEATDHEVTYNYILHEADGSLSYDWGTDKRLNLAQLSHDETLIIDSWNSAGAFENAFYTEPFRNVLLRENYTPLPTPQTPKEVTHIFKVKAPLLVKGQTLCLLGDVSKLKNWDTKNPILLSRNAETDFFTVPVDLSDMTFPVFYKYGVYDVEQNRFVRFEDGQNRVSHAAAEPECLTIVNDGFATLPSTTWKGAGIAIPVFSLRSENSFGVGEFTDLKLLADWCGAVGLKLIQILPINDTIATKTWVDSYPYAAISAFALHPIYLNLATVATAANQWMVADLEAERVRLNKLDALDYEAVMSAKLGCLRKLFEAQKAHTFEGKDYQLFFQENKPWLVPYAAFSALRDKFATPELSRWPQFKRYDARAIAAEFRTDETLRQAAFFYYFLQFHLHSQLQDAANYAHSHGIILKGDIAIGVSRNGADAWQAPELYHMEMQAGAPPDLFGIKGQNWGFPTYNWPRMKATGFAWWKQRFEQMGNYFDAFRIDHILGFFRIWSVPMSAVEGILGYFAPALPVHANEFIERGVAFDRNRFIKPFITNELLSEIFGEEHDFVKREFLDADRFGNLSLKPQFDTQRQVEAHFAAQKQDARNERLKLGLYDLISNVLLLEAEDSGGLQFHFRFDIERTFSFKKLDPHTQSVLKDLYVNYFFRRQDDFWMREAMQKLPALKRVTNMLVCGEDLGLVPACVPKVMKQLGLLSLEIQRMPKDSHRQFFNPKEAPYLSVVTPSTHDMSTIRGWWEEDRMVTQNFWNLELGQSGEAPPTCDAWVNRLIVEQHLASPAMWSIFQFQDLLGMDEQLRRKNPGSERINVPANPKNYWRYRMHLSLEDLKRAKPFNTTLAEAVRNGGR